MWKEFYPVNKSEDTAYPHKRETMHLSVWEASSDPLNLWHNKNSYQRCPRSYISISTRTTIWKFQKHIWSLWSNKKHFVRMLSSSDSLFLMIAFNSGGVMDLKKKNNYYSVGCWDATWIDFYYLWVFGAEEWEQGWGMPLTKWYGHISGAVCRNYSRISRFWSYFTLILLS